MGLAWYLVPVSDTIVRAATGLLERRGAWGADDRRKLLAVVNGAVKHVDVRWWRKVNGVTPEQVNRDLDKKHQEKLAKVRAMTDRQANPNKHQRAVAQAALAKLAAQGPPKATHIASAPGLEDFDRARAGRRVRPLPASGDELLRQRRGKPDGGVNTTKRVAAKPATKPSPGATKAKPKTRPVNTTKPPETKPRTADRHREPNRDRHRPGYMADYMRRRREAEREGR